MVKVKSSRGGFVNVHILGVGATVTRLRLAKKEIENAGDLGVVKAGAFIEDEVKESIIGNRAEPKSVDTGRFGNSIQFKKTGNMQGVIHAKRESYPKSNTTTEEVATLMEFGTSSMQPRKHFRNTEKRNESKVKDIIKEEINSANKQNILVGVQALRRLF